jgi:hypothetical protein
VLKGVAKVRHWWQTSPSAAPSSIPYQVTCICGTIAAGYRQPHHQVVTCAGCGRKFFVLPASPLPPVDSFLAKSPASPSGDLKQWRRPLIAAGLTFFAASVIIATLLYRHLHPPAAVQKPRTIGQHMDAGRTLLAQGKFFGAVQELELAEELQSRRPDLLSRAERRELSQLHRQAALMANLLPESLGEILHHAAELVHQDEQEWQRVFAERYRGKSLVFDAEIGRDDGGRIEISYAFFVRGRQARLDLTNLQLFKTLPLQQPQRLLFGLRLADVRLEAEGIWAIRFESDGGVLLTDLGAAAACCAQPEEELRELVERQAAWLANQP